MPKFDRIIIIIMDGAGCGVQKDYKKYHSFTSNTLLGVFKKYPRLRLPNLEKLGLSKIFFNKQTQNSCAGKIQVATVGNDTFFGLWEMFGVIIKKRFKSDKKGFSRSLLKKMEHHLKVQLIGNEYIEGFLAINKYFDEQKNKKGPILYFAEDGIVLLTAHKKILGHEKLKKLGKKLASLLQKENDYVRVITRPFQGKHGRFVRDNRNRRDFIITKNLSYHSASLLKRLKDSSIKFTTNRHIHNLLGQPKFASLVGGTSNRELLSSIEKMMEKHKRKQVMLFCLNDFDALGHKKDHFTYKQRLVEFDRRLTKIINKSDKKDLIIITADHGCNPNINNRYHTREMVPLLIHSKQIRDDIWFGTRNSLADIGQTVCHNFSLTPLKNGEPLLEIF